jgi:hypothetical protein
MLKWILGCLGVAVIVVCFAAWYGYRQLKNFAKDGPASTVTIGAPPSRVFASLADPDSMKEWRSEGLGIRSSRHGLLAVGDSVEVESSSSSSTSNRRSRSTWVVTAMIPDVLLALEVRSDSTRSTVFMRRDSLVSVGDSTQVFSSFTAPMLDSLQRKSDSKGRAAGAVMGMASNVMIAALRVMSEQELKRLKRHFEGRPPQ